MSRVNLCRSRSTAICTRLGNTRVSRAGDASSRSRTFLQISFSQDSALNQRLLRPDAETRPRDACATQSLNPRDKDARQVVDCNAFLFHRIAITQRDCITQRGILLPKRFKINGDSERGANFILTAIPAADSAALIIENGHVWSQKTDNLFGFRNQLRIVL